MDRRRHRVHVFLVQLLRAASDLDLLSVAAKINTFLRLLRLVKDLFSGRPLMVQTFSNIFLIDNILKEHRVLQQQYPVPLLLLFAFHAWSCLRNASHCFSDQGNRQDRNCDRVS